MRQAKLLVEAISGSLLLLPYTYASPALHVRDDDPLEKHLNMDTGGFPHGACTQPNDFSNPDSRLQIWFHGHGGDLVEYYLRNEGEEKHDNVDWAQDIFKILQPNQNPGQLSCNGSADSCTIGNLNCDEDFHTWPAAFYTFISLQNIHTFFGQYLERLTWMKGNLTNDIEVLVDDFKADVNSREKVNVWAIVAAALGMSAGLTAPVAQVSGTFGALSGFAGLIANTRPGEGGLEELGQLKSNLATILNNICESAYKSITSIQDAIYGHEGADEKSIPQEMLYKDDYSKDYQHPTALALGGGQWLLDHPAGDLRANFDAVGAQVKQTLALQLMRLFHKAYLVVITEGVEENCNKLPNAVWDKDGNVCYDLVNLNKKSLLGVDTDDWNIADFDIPKPLWEKYGADKLITYKNIVDCWVANGGKMGTPTLSATTPGTDIKQCFFSIEVKKGKVEITEPATGTTYLKLVSEDEFPNFSGEDKINHGGRPSSCKETADCTRWPIDFNL